MRLLRIHVIIEIDTFSVRHKCSSQNPTDEFVMLLMGSIDVTVSVQIIMDQDVKQVEYTTIYVGESCWV